MDGSALLSGVALPVGFGSYVASGRDALLAQLPPEAVVATMHQVHGSHTRVLREPTHDDISETDALVTRLHEQVLVAYTRDCVPCAVRDEQEGVAGVAHFSAQSLAEGLGERFFHALQLDSMAHTQVFIGAHHRAYWLPATHHVVAQWQQHRDLRGHLHTDAHDQNKVYVDIGEAVRSLLQGHGVRSKNITVDTRNTHTHALLPSSRRASYDEHGQPRPGAEREQLLEKMGYLYTTVTL